jgi:hypothetical protein
LLCILVGGCAEAELGPGIAPPDGDEGKVFELAVSNGEPARLVTPSSRFDLKWVDATEPATIQIEVLPMESASVSNRYRISLVSGELTGAFTIALDYGGSWVAGKRALLATFDASGFAPLSSSRYLLGTMSVTFPAETATFGTALIDATPCDRIESRFGLLQCEVTMRCGDETYELDCPGKEQCDCIGPEGTTPGGEHGGVFEACGIGTSDRRTNVDSANLACGWNFTPYKP